MKLEHNALQRQADELDRLAPKLAPSTLPWGIERDILALAEKEGDQGCQALLEVLAAAGGDVKECSLCGEPGEFEIDPDAQESEAAVLRTTVRFALQFDQKLLRPIDCSFACGLCRQLRNTGSLLQELATGRVDEDGDAAEGLLEHLALVNELLDIAENPVTCYAWGQEVLARAYALQIASSNIAGWKLMNPDGRSFEAGLPGAAANLVLQLLLPDATAEQRASAIASGLGNEQPGVENSKSPPSLQTGGTKKKRGLRDTSGSSQDTLEKVKKRRKWKTMQVEGSV